VARFELALHHEPENIDAHWLHGIALLAMGKFEQGWPEYEISLEVEKETLYLPAYQQPIWDGSSLKGRTILLYTEQGLGTLCNSFAMSLSSRHAAEGAAGLPRRVAANPGQLPGHRSADRSPGHYRAFRRSCRSLELAGNLQDLALHGAAQVPYLFADAGLAERWRDKLKQYRRLKPAAAKSSDYGRLFNGRPDLQIGIAWQGNPKHRWDHQRSISLAQFAPLARIQGVQLFSLQKGPGSEQLPIVSTQMTEKIIDLGGELKDLTDTAAVMRIWIWSSPAIPPQPTWPAPWSAGSGWRVGHARTGAGCGIGRQPLVSEPCAPVPPKRPGNWKRSL